MPSKIVLLTRISGGTLQEALLEIATMRVKLFKDNFLGSDRTSSGQLGGIAPPTQETRVAILWQIRRGMPLVETCRCLTIGDHIS